MMEIFTCEQNSPEWIACRLGLVTASRFATVMAEGRKGTESKTRAEYMRKLAGEILTGEPMDSYQNAHMERGQIMEDEARGLYCFEQDVEVTRVGFIRNGKMGCSPDSLIGEDRGLEIKTALAHIQIERLERNDLPPEHKAQVQGSMLVTGRPFWDFVSYSPKLPLLVITVKRDDGYIANLKGEIARFNAELDGLVERIRHYGEPAPVNILAAG